MKNGVKTALAVGFILLVIGLALFALPLLRGASIRDVWDGAAADLNGNFNLGVVSTGFGNLRDYTVCRDGEASFSPDEVKKIDLGWISGTVKLAPGGSDLHVKESCAKALKDDQKLCWKLEGGTLYLRFCTAARTSSIEKDLVLSFPAGWTAESVGVSASSADIELHELTVAGRLSVDTTSGDTLLDGCGCRTLSVGATSGALHLNDCRSEELDAGTTSGAIGLSGCETRTLRLAATSGALQAEGCVCDRLEAGTTSGSVNVGCRAKSITIGSTSGDIRCEGVPAGCDVDIDTTSGEVKLGLKDASDGQRIEIETTSGDVYLDVPGAMDLDYDTSSGDMSGHLTQGGSGCPQVEVETTSGNLILGAFD